MLRTEKMPRQLLAAVMAIEQALGRKRTVAKGPRTIDIDILLFGRSVMDVPGLTFRTRPCTNGVLCCNLWRKSLAGVRHPVLRRTIRELLEDLPLGSPQVRKLNGQANEGGA